MKRICVENAIEAIENHKKVADMVPDMPQKSKDIYKLAHDHIIDIIKLLPRGVRGWSTWIMKTQS